MHTHAFSNIQNALRTHIGSGAGTLLEWKAQIAPTFWQFNDIISRYLVDQFASTTHFTLGTGHPPARILSE